MNVMQIALLAALTAWSVEAAEKARVLRVGGTVDAPEAGLRAAGLRFGEPSPLPPPEGQTYTRGAEQFTLFSAQELWRSSQLAGRWQDREGDVMMMGRASAAFPSALAGKAVARAEMQALIEKAVAPQEDDLQIWLGAFLGGNLSAPLREIKPAPMRLAEVRAGETAGGMRFGYLFRFRPGGGAPTNEWFAAGFLLARGTSPEESQKEIERSFLPSIQAVPRAARPAGAVGRGTGPATGGTTPAGMSPEFAAARQSALDSIRGLKGWRVAETTNYVILTSLPSGKDVLVKELQRSLEFLRQAYGRVVPAAKAINQPGIVRMFGESADYERYVDADMRWSGGYWDPGRGELVLRPQEWGSIKQKSDWLRGVLYHEAFHQYLSLGFGRGEHALWFNEGHAALMEGVEFTAAGVRVDEVERYAALIDGDLRKGALRVADLFSMTRSQFYAASAGKDSEEQRHANYARAWAVCYYLRKGVPLEANSPWAGMLDRYRASMIEAGDAAKATAACFEGVDMNAFESAVITFWSSSNRRGAAKKYDLFGQK